MIAKFVFFCFNAIFQRGPTLRYGSRLGYFKSFIYSIDNKRKEERGKCRLGCSEEGKYQEEGNKYGDKGEKVRRADEDNWVESLRQGQIKRKHNGKRR